jgi:hypothetical protein
MKTRALILVVLMSFCLLFTACQKDNACIHQHIITSVKKTETCVESGILSHICQNCGVAFTQTTPVGQHTFTETVTQEATCSEEGVITRTCTTCGTSEKTSTAPVEHQVNLYSLTPSSCTVCGATVENAANVPGNLWYGKNWVALGTSLTSQEQGKFVEPLAERTGLNVTNYGIPGGTAVKEILESVQTVDLSQADLITIEFGVNDWFSNIPLGSVGDRDSYVANEDDDSDEGSFAGTCYQIFTTLQKRAPQALIIFLTESTGQKYESNGEDCSGNKGNHEGLYQREYTDIAIAVAEFVGIPVIDAGSRSMINKYHPDYLEDQIRHSNLGGQQYAYTVWLELKDMAPLLKAD